MRVVYRQPMLEQISEAKAAAHRQKLEIDRIEVTPSEFQRLYREVYPNTVSSAPDPSGRGLGRFVVLDLPVKVVECTCSGDGACFEHR